MIKRLLTLSLSIICAIAFVSHVWAQDGTENGQFRLVQIFYTSADVYVDDELLVPDLAFTVATDFMPLEAGSHTITVAPTGVGVDEGTLITLEVEAGGHYTLVTMGEFETGSPTLLTIDQNTDFATYDLEGNSAIIIQNVPEAVPVDVWFVDNLVIENLSFGTYGTASAPLGHFTAQAVMVGDRSSVVFESHYFAVPRTTSLAYLSGTFPDKINRNFFTTTPDNMYDYLAAHASQPDSQLSILFELINAAGWEEVLSADTPYTLFAPTNDAFAALPAETLDAFMNDPNALRDALSAYLVEGNLTPHELQGEQSLTSLGGSALTTIFKPVETPVTVNGVATGLQHRVNNGIIYEINALLLPSE